MCFAQSEDIKTEKVLRVNFINPGIDYELPVGSNKVISTGIGIGYGGSYPSLSNHNLNSGWVYLISPFLDVEYKKLYNFEKRSNKGKSTYFNSGNYVGIRFYTRFNTIESNFSRTDEVDFMISPVWGLQRSYGRLHLLFDAGPMFYFDRKGNGNFFPIMVQLNLGFNLKKWE